MIWFRVGLGLAFGWVRVRVRVRVRIRARVRVGVRVKVRPLILYHRGGRGSKYGTKSDKTNRQGDIAVQISMDRNRYIEVETKNKEKRDPFSKWSRQHYNE